MSNTQQLTLNEQTANKLQAYAELLEKSPSSILNEALENYFLEADKVIVEKSMHQQDPDTDISFDEFWDDVDI